MSKLIDEIASLRERIINAPIQIAWKPALQKEMTIRNAMGSSAIEGYVLSISEVKALASKERIEKQLNLTERAVFNYLSALRYINKNADKKNVTDTDICKLHGIIGEGAVEHGSAGVYRNIQNYVVNGLGDKIYTPPSPNVVPDLMKEFTKWINEESSLYLPVISSGIIHYHFVEIHPFVDGNGRVARALGTWELLRRKFDTLHIFAIDDIIYEHKKNYYFALNLVQKEKGDLTRWLEFYLEIVAESLDLAWKRIVSLPKTDKLERLTLTPKQEKLLTILRDSGSLSAKEIAFILKVTVQGVHFLIKPLIEAKIVKRQGGRKTGKFNLEK
ncbi:MAG: Fic family protein [Candidatus Firestonebacteria bacterium]|nr:Fic family protein [Candidatus Firestonebacteria bacterium]